MMQLLSNYLETYNKYRSKLEIIFDLFIAILFLYLSNNFTGCDLEPSHNNRNSIDGILFGIVIDSVSNKPIDSVFIVQRCISDSLFFQDDHINIANASSCYGTWSHQNGKYGVWYPAEDQGRILQFDRMYAYKTGYKLWNYNPKRDTIIHKVNFNDSLCIRLVKK